MQAPVAAPQGPVKGSAFGPFYKLMTGLVLVLISYSGWLAIFEPSAPPAGVEGVGGAMSSTTQPGQAVHPDALKLLGLGYVMLLYMAGVMVTSTTQLANGMLKQRWFWKHEVDLNTITYVKWIHFKGFDWLIAPRLCVRTGSGPFKTFYAHDPALRACFSAWSQAYSQLKLIEAKSEPDQPST